MVFFGKTRIIPTFRPSRRTFGRIGSLAATAIAVFMMCPAIASQPPAPPAENLLLASARRLAELPAVEARLRQRVELFGQTIVGRGVYLQKRTPRGVLLRLDLTMQVGGREVSLTQVCDGRFLWIRRDLDDANSLSRVDIQRVAEATRKAKAKPLSDSTTNWLVLGGLPRLLESLDEHFEFAPPRPAKMDKSQVWILEGTWRAKRLAKLLPDQAKTILAGKPADLTQLAPQLPSHVVVVFGQADLMPYRIEYRRVSHQASGAGAVSRASPLVVLDLLELRRRDDLEEDQFRYDPGEQEVADQTDLYLETLGLAQPSPSTPQP